MTELVSLAFHPETKEICTYVQSGGNGKSKRETYYPLDEFEYRADGLPLQNRTPAQIVQLVQASAAAATAPAGAASTVLDIDWNDISTEFGLANIHPYQRNAIHKTVHALNGRMMLGFDQGTGKTPPACMLRKHYKGRCMVVVLGRKKRDWKEEFEKWAGIHDCQIVKSSKDVIKSDTIIISFELAKTHPEIPRIRWNMVIVDESHELRNLDTVYARNLCPVVRAAKCVLLLSGTPMLSKPSELFLQFQMLFPDTFVSWEEFTARYCKGHFDRLGEWITTGRSNERELHVVLKQFMVRVLKKDVLPYLPAKNRIMVRVSPRDCMYQAKYVRATREIERKRKTMYKDRDPDSAHRQQNRIMSIYGRMWHDSGVDKSKLCRPWLYKMLTKYAKEKAIVFAYHGDVIANLNLLMEQARIPSVCVIGSTKKSAQEEMMASFKLPYSDERPDDPRVAVLSFECCSTGLNLMGVTRIYFVEMPRDPSTFFQCEDRAHRIGLHAPLYSYILNLANTRDQETLLKLGEKGDVCDAIINGEDSLPTFVIHGIIDVN